MKKKLIFIFIIALAVSAAFGAVELFQLVDGRYPWIWMYVLDELRPNPTHKVSDPKHIMFVFVDHFEPHDQETVDRWMNDYPALADRHWDADGRRPQHSWFWYFSESDLEEKKRFLSQLSTLAFERYGEIELHMHHGNDTEESFTKLMNEAIGLTQQVGGMITAEPKPRTAFGFIHGMWSLDNSRGAGVCGVNNELILLRKLGCYADFTHPSWGPMHPRVVNRLYYATDDPERPKSEATGIPMTVGEAGVGDLLIFEGPSVVRFNSIRPVYDHGDVTMADLPAPERIDAWIRAGIHVQGRPEWIFVKVFTHGAIAEDHEAVLGKWVDQMHTYLETRYNDKINYVLHYVTAREAYNIAKAAEAGKEGDPNGYRDFFIPPYVNRFLTASVPFETISFDKRHAVVKFFAEPERELYVRLRAKDVKISGDAILKEKREAEDQTWMTLVAQKESVVGFSFDRFEEGAFQR